MIAHQGRLYGILKKGDFHPYRQYIANTPPSWPYMMSPYLSKRFICLMHDNIAHHHMVASELSECLDGFTAKFFYKLEIQPALRKIQKFWRLMLLKRVYKYAPLFVDALSKRSQTWLQVGPDILIKIQALALR